jgi:hypothetical protein
LFGILEKRTSAQRHADCAYLERSSLPCELVVW